MVKAVAGRIPTNITVRLRVITLAVTVINAFFTAIADALAAFSGRCNNRSTIARQSKVAQIDQTFFGRDIKEVILENVEEPGERRILKRRLDLELLDELIDCDLLYRQSLFTFLRWFLHLCLWLTLMWRKVLESESHRRE